MPSKLHNAPATHARLQHVATRLRFSDAAYLRALEVSAAVPDSETWVRRIDRFLLSFGVVFIVAGIAAFFAYNWADLHKFAKFALIEAAIIICVASAWWRGLDSLVGRAALLAAGFLVGVLFAIYGQVYQTGADPYGLFVIWALLIAGWAIIGRQAGLWFLLLVLANLSLILFWTQVLRPEGTGLLGVFGPLVALAGTVTDQQLASFVFALNAVALVTWETFAQRGSEWMGRRWFPRAAAVIALATIVIVTLLQIFGARFGLRGFWYLIAPLFYAGFAAASLWYYQFKVRDLFMLMISLFGGIMILTAFAGRSIGGGIGVALVLAILLLGQTAGAALWLRAVARRWEESA